MTIDEAIAQQKLASKFKREMWEKSVLREKNEHLLSQAKEHEQLAEWLEELKALRHEANEWRKAGYSHGYNKAIDDMYNELSELLYHDFNITLDRLLEVKNQLIK